MPRYNSRVRKGRSPLQKEQMERARMGALACRRNTQKIEAESHSCDASNTSEYNPAAKALKTTGSMLKDMRKVIEKMRKLNKNALQREKNAKSKINSLREVANIKCEQLSELCKEQKSAEIELQQLRLRSNENTREIIELREQIHQLQLRVAQNSQELVTSSMSLKNQLNKSLKLEARNKDLHRSRDALRKRFQRMHTKMAQKQMQNVSENDNGTRVKFNLKDRTGAIRPEVRDMLRNLASEGVLS